MELSKRGVVWLIPTFLTLHNTEEALTFPEALPRARTALPESLAGLGARLTFPVLLQALVIISVLAFGLAAVATSRSGSRAALWLLLSLEVAVGINAIAHVATAAFVFRGYGPGLATALLINAPFVFYCMRRARRERWVSPMALGATVPAAVVLHGPVLLGGLWLAASLGG